MITKSFILLDRIGADSERRLWQQGILDWRTFLATDAISGIGSARKHELNVQIERAKHALWNEQYEHIIRALPRGEQWRLYDMLHDEACYLDIETTGYYGDITVIGIHDGENSHFLVKNANLDRDEFIRIIQRFKMIITFNGSSFDLPIIEKYFGIRIPHVHVDLRHVSARLGYTGGLKSIEKQLGITRGEEAQGVDGADAIYLWNQWQSTRERHYLQTLLAYNEEDIVNLEPLARRFIKELWAKTYLVTESG